MYFQFILLFLLDSMKFFAWNQFFWFFYLRYSLRFGAYVLTILLFQNHAIIMLTTVLNHCWRVPNILWSYFLHKSTFSKIFHQQRLILTFPLFVKVHALLGASDIYVCFDIFRITECSNALCKSWLGRISLCNLMSVSFDNGWFHVFDCLEFEMILLFD